jgi:hypothetical protein
VTLQRSDLGFRNCRVVTLYVSIIGDAVAFRVSFAKAFSIDQPSNTQMEPSRRRVSYYTVAPARGSFATLASQDRHSLRHSM